MYGLRNRDKYTEMELRYKALVNTFSSLLSTGVWDIEELFDSENNIEVADIVRFYVEETGELPNRNTLYREALYMFAAEHGLEVFKDIDIFTNGCLDTILYARADLDEEIVQDLEDLFNLPVNEMR